MEILSSILIFLMGISVAEALFMQSNKIARTSPLSMVDQKEIAEKARQAAIETYLRRNKRRRE